MSDLDALFSALTDPTRRAIVERLRDDGEASAGELQRPFALSQPAVSRHLKTLQRAGLVTQRRAGVRRLFRLAPHRLADLDAWLARFRAAMEANYTCLDTLMETAMDLDTRLDGDTDLILTRRVAAPPARLYEAHTAPALLRRWLIGLPGAEMTECEHDLRPGGAFRMAWRGEGFPPFSITGTYVALEPPDRIEHVERMHLPDGDTPDTRVVTLFQPDGEGTRMEMRLIYPDAAARDAAVASGMTDGMAASYANLDGVA